MQGTMNDATGGSNADGTKAAASDEQLMAAFSQGFADAFADKGEGCKCEDHCGGGIYGQPPRDGEVVLRLLQEFAPTGRRRWKAEPQIFENRKSVDVARDLGRRKRDDRTHRVRQHMTKEDAHRAHPLRLARLDELALAYAISVHKSQGSQYPAVVMPIHSSHYVMLRRNLLYTAITRAERVCVLVGTRSALQQAVRNQDERLRFSRLASRLHVD